jgi:hypothetical protein
VVLSFGDEVGSFCSRFKEKYPRYFPIEDCHMTLLTNPKREGRKLLAEVTQKQTGPNFLTHDNFVSELFCGYCRSSSIGSGP